MATLAHEKKFYRILATIKHFNGESFNYKSVYCGRIFTDKINGLGIAFGRAITMYPDKDIVSADLIPERGVLPIPRTKNLCNGCKSQGDCVAMCHEGQ